MDAQSLNGTDVVPWSEERAAARRRLAEATPGNAVAAHPDMDDVRAGAIRWADASLAPRYHATLPPGLPAQSPFTLDEALSPSFEFDAGFRRLAVSDHISGEV